jgi:hypothetical protein
VAGPRRLFRRPEAFVLFESRLRLDTRLTAAPAGLVPWPAPPETWPALLRWRLGAPAAWLAATVALLVPAHVFLISRDAASTRFAGPPPSLLQTKEMLAALADLNTADPAAERARRPGENQFAHSALEAADDLRDQAAAAALGRNPTPPTAMLAESGGTTAAMTRRPLVWEKIAPGRFRTTVALRPGKVARGAVRVGTTALPFGPLTVAGAAEWAFDRARLAELQALSAASGGQERLDLAEVWRAPRPVAWRPVRAWVLMALAVLLVTEAALTRLGYSLMPRRWERG